MGTYLSRISMLLLFFMIFSSCNKSYRLIKRGEFEKVDFLEEIDCRYSRNLILVDVEIGNKMYTCVLDTGAEVSVFDSQLFDEIPHKEVANQKVSGAAGIKNNFKFLEIPQVNIGNLEFFSLVAISADLSAINDLFKCKETIHGIIGSNMMRKAKWRIDYQQEKIWISDKLSSFGDLQNDIVINLECGKVGSAYINASLDGVERLHTFDTGKSTKIQSNIDVFNQLSEKKENLQYTQSKGATGVTLNGLQYGIVNYTLVDEMKLGEVILNNQIVEIKDAERSSSLIGNGIWENYILTIDWDNCNLYLNPTQKVEEDSLYKFEYNISNNKSVDGFRLSSEWLQHPSTLDIDSDNEIIEIEGINVTHMNDDEYCDFLDNKLPLFKEQDTMAITVLNNGKKEKITLSKKKLLPQ